MTSHPMLRRSIAQIAITGPQVACYPALRARLDTSLAQVVGTITPEEHWLEVPIGNGWLVAYRLQHTGRGSRRTTQILEARIFPDEGGNRRPGEWSVAVLGTPTQHLRTAFSFDRVRRGITERSFDAALAATAKNAIQQGAGRVFGMPGIRHAGSHREGRGAGRPPAFNDAFYAQLAVRYHALEHSDRREPGASTRRTLAEQYRRELRRDVTEGTISKWLAKACAHGFLTPAHSGSRRRMATEAARDTLAARASQSVAVGLRRPSARSTDAR